MRRHSRTPKNTPIIPGPTVRSEGGPPPEPRAADQPPAGDQADGSPSDPSRGLTPAFGSAVVGSGPAPWPEAPADPPAPPAEPPTPAQRSTPVSGTATPSFEMPRI